MGIASISKRHSLTDSCPSSPAETDTINDLNEFDEHICMLRGRENDHLGNDFISGQAQCEFVHQISAIQQKKSSTIIGNIVSLTPGFRGIHVVEPWFNLIQIEWLSSNI